MSIKWKKNKNLNPDLLLERIGSIVSVKKDGGISFSSFDYMELNASLYSMIEFGKKMDWSIKEEIVSTAIINSIKNKKLNRNDVINEINKQLKEIRRRRETEFVFLSTLSLSEPIPIKKVVILGCSIRIFTGSYPKKYNSRKKHENKWRFNFDHTPSAYSKVIVNCKAKFPEEAVSKSLEALDILRAILCLLVNPRIQLTFGSTISPINKIRLGGMHSLHKKNGNLAIEYFWYETNFVYTNPHLITDNSVNIIKINVLRALKQLIKSSYGEVIQDCLLKCVRALDEPDSNTASLRLWGALEALSASGDGRYDSVTRRCSFLFADRKYHKQMLEHLREYRNSNIHAGEEFKVAKTYCYQMQYYLYHLIFFHLYNADEFNSMEDANMFLDMPSNINLLKKRKGLIVKAINFVSKTTKV